MAKAIETKEKCLRLPTDIEWFIPFVSRAMMVELKSHHHPQLLLLGTYHSIGTVTVLCSKLMKREVVVRKANYKHTHQMELLSISEDLEKEKESRYSMKKECTGTDTQSTSWSYAHRAESSPIMHGTYLLIWKIAGSSCQLMEMRVLLFCESADTVSHK